MSRNGRPWLNVSGLRCLPVVRQATVAECGLACIAMIAAYFGAGSDLNGLRRRFGTPISGTTLDTIVRTAASMGLSARAVRCSMVELRRLKTPCILHWEFNHFVVLRKATRKKLVIHDPACGLVRESLQKAGKKFTGVALELEPSSEFRQRKSSRVLRLRDLLVADDGFASSISVAVLFALLSELLLLATPFYMQSVIDGVLVRGDSQLLVTLALGFGLLAAFQLLAGVMRQLTFQFLAQTTVFSLSTRVLRHLLHLPVPWFRSRSLGDIQQRMQSLAGIQSFVTQTAPGLFLDALFLLFVSVFMVAYAPTLMLLVVLVAGLYALWRVLIFGKMLEQANRLVRAEAASQTHLLESLRAAQSIKMMSGESQRTEDWQNLFVRRINTQIRIGNLGIADAAVHRGLFQALHIGIVYLLARSVLEGEMSIGQLSAFVAYTGMFAARFAGVINSVFECRLLRVPLDRLADIVFGDNEPYSAASAEVANFSGALQAKGLCFAFTGAKSRIIENCSLDAGGGEFVAIRGRSGCGKSTLLRLFAGIERPTNGELFYDRKPAAAWPLSDIRRQVATVFQDDALVSGTIASNIALFARDIDRQRLRAVARKAVIDGDIEGLPMAYETPIGDLGAALSSGQVQRILFARALYRRPRLLLLDEFTSGLDENTEQLLVAELLRLPVTRIVVTHSPAVMRAADRVFELRDGRLISL